jgi:hypothetical protein
MDIRIAVDGDRYMVRQGRGKHRIAVGWIAFDAGPTPWVVQDFANTSIRAFAYLRDARAFAKRYFGGEYDV